jgi:hypothetical protein
MKMKILSMAFVVLIAIDVCGQQPKGSVLILPSATDPAINTFDVTHAVYFNPAVKSRNKLVVFLPGTGGGGTKGPVLFSQAASDLGFHVISLTYPSAIAASICQTDSDEDCFENFRQEIITGQDRSSLIDVNKANSIENRLQKLLVYLGQNKAKEGWGRYLTNKNEIKWDDMILTGLSQGGGHAPLIAKYHRVSRVIMFSAPKDYDVKNKRPAKWYGKGATPTSRFFSFVHIQDRQGCDYPQQLEILRTMGLYEFGEPADIDKTPFPYNNSHILITNYPGKEVTSGEAHTSVMTDLRTPRDQNGVPLFKPVWIYMLTAK